MTSEFHQMRDEDLQSMMTDVLQHPSSADVDFINALSNEIERRKRYGKPAMTCFLCGEGIDRIPPAITGGLMGQPTRWVHEECRDACLVAEDIFHARDLVKRARANNTPGRLLSVVDELVKLVCDHDYQISGEGYLPPLDMPPARLPNGKELERLPNGKELERIYWREDVCRKCGHAVRVA